MTRSVFSLFKHIFVAGLLLVASTGIAWSALHEVNSDGSFELPTVNTYTDISSALTAADTSDTIEITNSGVYYMSWITVPSTCADVVFRGQEGETPTLYNSDQAPALVIAASGFTLENLIIYQVDMFQHPVLEVQSDNVTVRRCRIAILPIGVKMNIIDVTAGTGLTVVGCYFYCLDGTPALTGINFGTGTAEAARIHNNIFASRFGPAVYGEDGNGVSICNNTIYQKGITTGYSSGITFSGSVTDLTVMNNGMIGNGTLDTALVFPLAMNGVVANNAFSNYQISSQTGNLTPVNDVTTAPVFAGSTFAVSGNLEVSGNSPETLVCNTLSGSEYTGSLLMIASGTYIGATRYVAEHSGSMLVMHTPLPGSGTEYDGVSFVLYPGQMLMPADGSPYIDAGEDTVPLADTLDIVGMPRRVDGIDIGAVEYPAAKSAVCWHVNCDTGNDGNTGGAIDPFFTISTALSAAADGDTIKLAAFNYMNGPSYAPEEPMAVTQSGLVILGGYTPDFSMRYPAWGGDSLYSVIDGSIVYGAAVFELQTSSGGTVIDGIVFADADFGCISTSDMNQENTVISNCEFHGSDSAAAVYLGGDDYIRITNVMFDHNGIGLEMIASSYVSIVNNTFANNGTGISHGEGYGISISNCIMAYNGTGVDDQASASAIQDFTYNSFYGNWSVDCYSTMYGDMTPESLNVWYGHDNFSLFPDFLDTAAADYRLGGLSECIDAGDTISAFDVEPDPNGGRINLGVFGNTVLAATSGGDDSIPPYISQVVCNAPGEVWVVFNEPLDSASATAMANYSIAPGMTIAGVALQADMMTVVLQTAVHDSTVEYTLTLSNIADVNGNVIEANTSTSYWYVPVDGPTGPDMLWDRTYGGYHEDYMLCMNKTAEGNYIAAGPAASFGLGENDFWFMLFDENGDTLWSRLYGTPDTLKEEPQEVIQTADGGYLAAGFREGAFLQGYMIKIASDGSFEWEQTYRDSSIIYSVIAVTGGYVTAGLANVDTGTSTKYLWVMKTDSTGQMQWEKTYAGQGIEYEPSVTENYENGYFVVYDLAVDSTTDIALLQLDSVGDSLWQHTLGDIGNEHAKAVMRTVDGNFIVAGKTDSYGSGDEDVLLAKIDQWGYQVWQYTYGTADDEEPWDLDLTADGGYIVGGHQGNFDNMAGMDGWLLKTDEYGTEEWSRNYGADSADIISGAAEIDGGDIFFVGVRKTEADMMDVWVGRVGYGAVSNMTQNPYFSPDPGSGPFTAPLEVYLSCPDTTAAIYYTTDGSDPDTTSIPYSGPFGLSDGFWTVRAIAVAPGMEPSDIVYAGYSVGSGAQALDRQVSDGGDGWETPDGTGGINTPIYGVVFEDADSSGSWDDGEGVWFDGDGDNLYTDGTDGLLYGMPNDGATGIPGNLLFSDPDSSKGYTVGEDVWFDDYLNGYYDEGAAGPIYAPFVEDSLTSLLLHFDEGYGDTAYDASGNGNHAVTDNQAVWTGDGMFGSALYFSNGEIVTVADNGDLLDITGSFTVDLWVRMTNQSGVLMEKGSDYPSWRFDLSDGAAFFGFDDASNVAEIYWSGMTVADDTWHWLKLVFDRDKQLVYTIGDGVVRDSADISGLGDIASVSEIIFGKQYTGYIDEVRFVRGARYMEPETVGPSVVTNLHVVDATDSMVTLAWDPNPANENIASYRIYRDGEVIQDVTGATSYTDTDVGPDMYYTYAVEAVNTDGTAGPQATIDVSTSTGQGSISGTVTYLQPVDNLYVYAVPDDKAFHWEGIENNWYPFTRPGMDGTYRITGLDESADGYRVVVFDHDRVIDPSPAIQWYSDQTTYSAAQTVQFDTSAGFEIMNIDFALQPGGSVSGTLKVAESGEPTSGYVYAQTVSGETVVKTHADADGFYGISGIPAGVYVLYATGENQDQHLQPGYYPDKSELTSAQTVTVMESLTVENMNIFLTEDFDPPYIVSTSPSSDVLAAVTDSLVVVFSEPMSKTETENGFWLENGDGSDHGSASTGSSGTSSANGTFTWPDDAVMVFHPAEELQPAAIYRMEISGWDQAGNRLDDHGIWFITAGDPADTLPPELFSVAPDDGMSGVRTPVIMGASVDKLLDPATVNSSTIVLDNSSPAYVEYVPEMSVIAVRSKTPLATGSHTLTFTTGIQDVSGNGLIRQYRTTFIVDSVDAVAPQVLFCVPNNGAGPVPEPDEVEVVFDELMDQASVSLSGLQITSTSGTIPADSFVTVDTSWNDDDPFGAFNELRLMLNKKYLVPGDAYTFSFGSGLATDLAGNALQPYTLEFTLADSTEDPVWVRLDAGVDASTEGDSVRLLLECYLDGNLPDSISAVSVGAVDNQGNSYTLTEEEGKWFKYETMLATASFGSGRHRFTFTAVVDGHGAEAVRDCYVAAALPQVISPAGDTVGTMPALTWQSTPDAVWYAVMLMGLTDTTLMKQVLFVPQASATQIMQLTPNWELPEGDYIWRAMSLLSMDTESGAGFSDPAMFTVSAGAGPSQPSVPTGLAANAIGDMVSLVWNANPVTENVTMYYLYRQGPGGADTIMVIADTAYTDGGLVSGTYLYSVAAVNGAGTGPRSGDVTAAVTGGTVVPVSISLAPDSVSMTADDSLTFSVTAMDSTGATWDVSAASGLSLSTTDTYGWLDKTVYHPVRTGSYTVSASYYGLNDAVTVTVWHGALTAIDVKPDSATIGTDQSLSLSVKGVDADGNVWDTAGVEWDTDDSSGTLTATGTYTPGGEGRFRVWAALPAADSAGTVFLYDTAVVTVNQGSLVRITVSPADTMILHDGEVRYTATGYDGADNAWNDLAVTWNVTDLNGTIAGGVYEPGGTGTFTVTATYDQDGNGTVTGTARVDVRRNMPPAIVIEATFADGDTLNVSAVRYTITAHDTDGGAMAAVPQIRYMLSPVHSGWSDGMSGVTRVDSMLPPGTYTLSAAATDADGHADTAVSRFTVRTTAMDLPAGAWLMGAVPHKVVDRRVQSLYGAGSEVFRWDETRASDLFLLKYGNLSDNGRMLDAGQAAWILADDGSRVDLDGAEYLSLDTSIVIPLKAGWNQISNPFSFGVRWKDVRIRERIGYPETTVAAAADTVGTIRPLLASPRLYWYADNTYDWSDDPLFLPWQGYFVKARLDCEVVIKNPVTAFGAGAAIDAVGAGKAGSSGWTVRLTARSATYGDIRNYIGEGTVPYRAEEPLGVFGKYASLAMYDMETGELLAADIRTAEESGNIWTVRINTNTGEPVRLAWEPAAGTPRQLYLIDPEAGAVTDMLAVTSYTKAGPGEVYITTASPVSAEFQLAVRNLFVVNRPNPFIGTTVFTYRLPTDHYHAGSVRLTVYDRDGHPVDEIDLSGTVSGSAVWQAEGRRGLYFYRLHTDTGFEASGRLLIAE